MESDTKKCQRIWRKEVSFLLQLSLQDTGILVHRILTCILLILFPRDPVIKNESLPYYFILFFYNLFLYIGLQYKDLIPTPLYVDFDFPSGTSGKESTCQCGRHKRHGLNPWIRKIPWRREWQPTPIFLPGESHGQRSLAGYCSQGHKEQDMTEVAQYTCIHTWVQVSLFCLGNCSCSTTCMFAHSHTHIHTPTGVMLLPVHSQLQ